MSFCLLMNSVKMLHLGSCVLKLIQTFGRHHGLSHTQTRNQKQLFLLSLSEKIITLASLTHPVSKGQTSFYISVLITNPYLRYIH